MQRAQSIAQAQTVRQSAQNRCSDSQEEFDRVLGGHGLSGQGLHSSPQLPKLAHFFPRRPLSALPGTNCRARHQLRGDTPRAPSPRLRVPGGGARSGAERREGGVYLALRSPGCGTPAAPGRSGSSSPAALNRAFPAPRSRLASSAASRSGTGVLSAPPQLNPRPR